MLQLRRSAAIHGVYFAGLEEFGHIANHHPRALQAILGFEIDFELSQEHPPLLVLASYLGVAGEGLKQE